MQVPDQLLTTDLRDVNKSSWEACFFSTTVKSPEDSGGFFLYISNNDPVV